MLKTGFSRNLNAPSTVLSKVTKPFFLVLCLTVSTLAGCTTAMQQKADRTFLSLKKSISESIRGNQIEDIAIPADALAARPASLSQLLRKVGQLAVKEDRIVEITSVARDRNYLRRGVAKGGLETGKKVKITMLATTRRSNTRIVFK